MGGGGGGGSIGKLVGVIVVLICSWGLKNRKNKH